MIENIDIIIYTAFILCGVSLTAAVILFFTLNIPSVIKDMRGSLEKRQIEEIRTKNTSASQRSSAANVFEEMQQKADSEKGYTKRNRVRAVTGGRSTGSLNTGSISAEKNPSPPSTARTVPADPPVPQARTVPTSAAVEEDAGTVVLKQNHAGSEPEFFVIKKMVFVCSTDVLE